MRLSKDQADANRRAIVEAASELIRQRGVDAVSIGDVTKAAGFTHGGFYNHFASKEDLVATAFDAAFEQYLDSLTATLASDDSGEAFKKALSGYLSPAHRDNPQTGCPTAALVSDAGRSTGSVQAAYARGVEGYLNVFEEQLAADEKPSHGGTAKVRAMRTLNELVGSIVLARAVSTANPSLADELLSASRSGLAPASLGVAKSVAQPTAPLDSAKYARAAGKRVRGNQASPRRP